MPVRRTIRRPYLRPSVAGLVLALVWAGALAVALVWLAHTPASLTTGADYAIALARLTGLLTGYSVVVLVALMARLRWVERRVGSDRLARWHAVGGRYTVIAVLCHVLSVVWGYAGSSRLSVGRQVVILLRDYPDVLLATVAAGLLVGVGMLSARAVRRAVGYETWYRLHLLTYVAIGLAFSHQFANGTDFAYHPAVRASWTALYVGVAAAVCYARVARPLLDAARHRLVVTDVVAEGGGAVSITVGGRDLGRLHAQSGQFFRLRFLTRGRWRQAHPFSLSAAPTPERFRFTVKPVGDHTRALRALAPGTRVLAAGPFGSLTAQRRRKPKVLLIAGGIGITPLRALLESLPGEPGDVTLIYRCRSEAEAPLRGELDELARQRGATVRYVVGPRSDDGCRLDGRLLAGLVGGLSEHDVYLCAPPALATSVTAVLRGAGVPAGNIHRESFELGTSPRGRLRHTAATSLGLAALAAAFAARTDAAGHATQSGPAGLAAAPQGASPSGRSLPGNTGEVVVPGSLQRTLYTTVQVAAVLRDGRLVDVRALALPNLDARSRQISAVAAPVLRREAISAGSADIDMVSGATFTSAAYARSLQAALDSRPSR